MSAFVKRVAINTRALQKSSLFKAEMKQKLLSRKYVDERKCWLWPGSRDRRGYGIVCFRGLKFSTHRVSAMLWLNAPLRGDRVIGVLHRCGVKHCYNPAHLYQGTQQQNVRDALLAGTILRGEDSPQAKLTFDRVVDIRQMRLAGWSGPSIARRIGVTPAIVYKICNGNDWGHIRCPKCGNRNIKKKNDTTDWAAIRPKRTRKGTPHTEAYKTMMSAQKRRWWESASPERRGVVVQRRLKTLGLVDFKAP